MQGVAELFFSASICECECEFRDLKVSSIKLRESSRQSALRFLPIAGFCTWVALSVVSNAKEKKNVMFSEKAT